MNSESLCKTRKNTQIGTRNIPELNLKLNTIKTARKSIGSGESPLKALTVQQASIVNQLILFLTNLLQDPFIRML